MKKFLGIVIIVLAGIAIYFGMPYFKRWSRTEPQENIQTYEIIKGNMVSAFSADGIVKSNQTAFLTWQTSGQVKDILVEVGTQVVEDQVLAVLRQDSLSQPVILAQVDLNTAKKELEQLQQIDLQQAQARERLENAQQAYEDALNQDVAQANAQAALAESLKAVEIAEQSLEILIAQPTKEVIQQSLANLYLRKNSLFEAQEEVNRLEAKLAKNPANYAFWESKPLYKKLLSAAQIKLTQEQINYENFQARYNELLAPPDPVEVFLAQTGLTRSKAQQQAADRELERVLKGLSAGDLAVLEAQIKDAKREWERIQNGSDPADLIAVEARISAAQAVLLQSQITAPFSGTITEIIGMEGDIVKSGSTAFRMDDISTLLVEIPVSEITINQIFIGQTVLFGFDAIPGTQFRGKIREISVVGTIRNGLVEFNVLAEVLYPDERVKPGISGDAQIVLEETKDVLLVPSQSIRNLNSKRVVYLLRGDEVVPVEVELGSSESNFTEILSANLAPGDILILNPPKNNSPDG